MIRHESGVAPENDSQLQPLLQPPKEGSSPPPEAVRSLLEEVLSDTSVPHFQRIRKATWIELKILFRLAFPAIFVYLLNNVTSMSTQIFVGHLGNLELAAASLGNNGIQLIAYGLMVNIICKYQIKLKKSSAPSSSSLMTTLFLLSDVVGYGERCGDPVRPSLRCP